MPNIANNNETLTQYAERMMSLGYTPDEIKIMMREEGIIFPNISSILSNFIAESEHSIEVIARLADMEPSTIYRILKQKRNPTRNTILSIAIALELSLKEAQILLKSGNCATLSASRDRDLVIMNSIIHKDDFDTVNEILKRNHMELILSSKKKI